MTKLLNTLKAVALVALITAAVFVCVLLRTVNSSLKAANSSLAATSAQLNGLLSQTQKTGLEVSKLVNDSRATLVEVNRDALDERKYFEVQLPELLAQTTGVLANVQTATADLDPLLKETTARVADLKPIEANAAILVDDGDKLIADPAIPDSIAHLDQASVQLAVAAAQGVAIAGDVKATTGSVKAIAADGQAEVHALTHPKPLAQIADWTLKVVHAFGGWIF
jgi:hypothetical protein